MSKQPVKICGELSFVTIYPSGWGMGKVKTEDGVLSVNGEALNGLKRFSAYEFSGHHVHHPKYGSSIKVDSVQVFVPDTKESIVKFLCKNYSGVGEKTATRFIENFLKTANLQELREQIINNPFALDFSSITKKRIESKDKGGMRGAIYRQFATRLGGMDTSDGIFRTLANYYEKKFKHARDPVGSSWDAFVQNPYAPIREVSGYGFVRADVLAKKLQFPLDAPPRIAALATHALDEGCNTNGHTFLTIEDFEQRISALDQRVEAHRAIDAAINLGEPIVIVDNRYYVKKYYLAEKFLAANFANRKNHNNKPLFEGDETALQEAIDAASKVVGIALDHSQYSAVRGILESNKSIHSVCGNPGCGKTAIMEVVVNILSKKLILGFCAPTGKAAKVLSARVEKIGCKATTIHSMLGVGERGGFAHHRENLLPFDLLVIDETSMVDVSLMNSVVSAVREDCHIVFLGDSKQLPSIGPGNCLENILQLPFDHHLLTKTHRNDGGLLEVIKLCGQGQADFTKKRDDVLFSNGLPEANELNVEKVLELYDRDLQDMGGDYSLVGLLIARRKGDINTPGWNITHLNHVMREKYNGFSQKVPGTIYRIGDRIIIRKNLSLVQPPDETGYPAPTEYVVNGDTGYIRQFSLKEQADENGSAGTISSLTLELDDGREISYPAGAIESLSLAYAMTVHSAQGSEYQRVISICVNGPPNFIHRGILFTAWSRAQKKLTVIGELGSIVNVLKRPTPTRNSYLVEQTHALSMSNSNAPIWDVQ